MRPHPFLAVLPLAALACEQDAASPGGTAIEVRDSAGVRIVENPAPPEGSRLRWRIGPEPAVSIGVLEGDDPYMLDSPWGATRLPDGRIVVADSGPNELRVFDESGAYLETWGGRGQGPGEFRGLIHVERWPGDSVAAWYGPRRGISVFNSDGSFGRNFTLERNPDDPSASFVRPFAVRGDGSIMAGHDPHIVETVTVEIRDAEGRLRSSLGSHPGDESYIAHEGTDRAMKYRPIFGAIVAEAPWGDLIVHGLNNRYEIRAFAEDGTLARIVRRDHAPRLPTREDVEAYIEEQVAWHPDHLSPSEIEEYREEQRREYRSIPVAESMPAFSSVKVDALDHLWVEEYEFPRDEPSGPSLWTVFDPEGRMLGYVEMPGAGLWIYEIGEDYVLIRDWDELGVQSVQLWPLERG